MPKQTARKCTGSGFMPYNVLARAKKAAAAGAAAAAAGGNSADGHQEEQDETSRDLSVSSAGMEDMKLFSVQELENKTKEELVQIVLRLQDSIQDIIAEDEDDDDFDGAGGGGEDDDDEDEDGAYGVIPADGVVHLDDDDDDDDELDDLADDPDSGDDEEEIVNGNDTNEKDDGPASESKD